MIVSKKSYKLTHHIVLEYTSNLVTIVNFLSSLSWDDPTTAASVSKAVDS